VLGKTFGPKRDEVTGKRRRPHKEKPYALYSLPNAFLNVHIMKNEMGGTWGEYRENEKCIDGFDGKKHQA
jgi:hypothetical protein